MNVNRILKEARPLFWPWCAVVLAATLPLFRSLGSIARISAAGFILGIPVLATLSLGNEFQHQTLSLLLSQPVNRMKIWREKLFVTTVAVLSAALIFFLTWRGGEFQLGWHTLVLAAALIAATITSATFWTLFTRSTVGGIVLNIAIPSFILYAVNMASWLRKPAPAASANVAGVSSVCLFIYAGVMLWLGRRALARFQAVGRAAGDDLLTAGPSLMPQTLTGWLRCRPKGAALNLFRKEICLLRPVWLICLVAAVCWACLTLVRLRLMLDSTKTFQIVVISIAVVCTLMIAILAGSLSLGEERTSGTHAWHLTLPVSPFLQWRIKLYVALFAGVLGAWLLPALITGKLFESPDMYLDPLFGTLWLIAVLILTFVSFWCACAANGTVRAVLWVFPVLIAVGLANVFGERAGRELVDVFVARFNPFASLRFATAVSRLGPNIVFQLIDAASENMTDSIRAALEVTTMLLVPALLLAVVQSYRLFRAHLQDRTLSVVRSLLLLAMTAFLCSFSLLASYTFVHDATDQTWVLLFGTRYPIEEILRRREIEKTRPGAANPGGTESLQLTVDDLARAFPPRFPLAESVRGELRNARITVTPDKAHPGGFFCEENPWKSTWCYYSATIHLADGSDLTESFEPRDTKFPFGRYSVYAHWPGAKGQESLWDR